MKKPITTRDWGKGLNKDQAPWELAPGFWSDGQNVRFRAGNAERVGGIALALTPTIAPNYLQAYSSGAIRYVAYAGTAKVYVHDGSSETEITRKNLPAGPTLNGTSGVSGGVGVLFYTTGAPGIAVGDKVTLTGFTPAVHNVQNALVTQVNSDNFSIANTAADGAITTYGIVTVVDGSYPTLNFTGSQDDKWTGGNFNGVLILNNPVDGLFYWDQSVSGKLRAFPNYTNKIDFARPFKNFIVYGGETVSGTKYRHRFGWSDAADPGTIPLYWTSSDTNLAGNVDLPSNGEIIDAWDWGEDLIIFKRDVRYRARYIGGNDVFDFQLISGNGKDDGLLAAGCVINTPKGQVFVTDGLDIRIHAGGESQSLVYGRMLKYFRGAVDSTYRKRTFLTINPYTNEVWVCFPESGQTSCTKALIWNWEDDAWGIRDLPSVTSGVSGELPTSIASSPRLILANATPKIGLADSGFTDFGSAYSTVLERTGMDFDTSAFKFISASMPRFDGASNFQASIFHGASPVQDGVPTYTSQQVYTHNATQRVMAMTGSGRYLAWKLISAASDTHPLRSIDFWLTQQGDW